MWKGLTHTGEKENENGEIKLIMLVHITWHLNCSRCESLENFENRNKRKNANKKRKE